MANKGQFKPGDARAGRRHGSTNKATSAARTAISSFIEGKATEVETLWSRVAEKDHAKALELYAKLAEFILPKLARTELSGDTPASGQTVIHRVEFVSPPKRVEDSG
jgi:hypothetical protein